VSLHVGDISDKAAYVLRANDLAHRCRASDIHIGTATVIAAFGAASLLDIALLLSFHAPSIVSNCPALDAFSARPVNEIPDDREP